MALTASQKKAIDELIFKNAKGIDIIDTLVRHHNASARDVSAYLKENKTLQGALKTITHRTKDVANAGDAQSRTKAVKEIETLAKKMIKVLQKKDEPDPQG